MARNYEMKKFILKYEVGDGYTYSSSEYCSILADSKEEINNYILNLLLENNLHECYGLHDIFGHKLYLRDLVVYDNKKNDFSEYYEIYSLEEFFDLNLPK